MYQVIVADDHTVVREGIAKIVEDTGRFTVCGQAADGEEALALIHEQEVHLALLDLMMPNCDGITALKRIKNEHPSVKVVILTMQTDRASFDTAIKAGAEGYLLKDDSSEVVLSVLEAVMNGHKSFSPRLQSILAEKYIDEASPVDLLTPRELEVLKLTVRGRKNKEIAADLEISQSTVEFHKKNLKEKLNANGLADLLNIAHKYGIQ